MTGKPRDTKNNDRTHPLKATGWLLTVKAEGHSQAQLVDALSAKTGFAFVGQQEVGEGQNHYTHWQVYLETPPMRWQTLKNLLTSSGFPEAHIEERRGTVQEAVDYVQKSRTSVPGTQFGYGVIDYKNQQGSRTDLSLFHEQIEHGMSVQQILMADSSGKAARYTQWLKELKTAYDEQTLGEDRLDLKVTYLYGKTQVGKTYYARHKYPSQEVYRVTDYHGNPWDSYRGQRVLILDEFRSQLDWSFLLDLLDVYPLELPARYSNHWAGFHEVYIISSWTLGQQYPAIQGEERRQLYRRIHQITEVTMTDGERKFTDHRPPRI
jgi:hypothetical protein